MSWRLCRVALGCSRHPRSGPEATRAATTTPLLTLAAKAGLRLGECLGLDFADCELVKGKGMINVRRQWTRLKELKPPKAGSRRAVPISDDLVRLLLEHKMAAVDKTGPVFASRAGWTPVAPQRRAARLRPGRHGRRPGRGHVPRPAPRLRLPARSKGWTARAIADAMGHKRTATTEIYIQRFNGDQSDENIRKAMTG